ncbi:MAG: glycosyl hydrolase family 18 protein [Ignavibacteria bacterium]
MKTLLLLVFIFLVISSSSFSQNPNPALIGYWQNWNDGASPYIPLTQIDTSYNIIPVAFAVPSSGTSYNITFTPDGISSLALKQQIDTMHLRGKKVIISIGGANDPVTLNDTNQRNTFATSVMNIINTYGLDGIDIDFEGSSISVSGGTIANPTDAKIINLIYAIRMIMDQFRILYGKKMILTMAPETAFVQGGMSAYGGIWGAYLPVIHALRDSIEVLQVQLYNSGSMYGIDGQIYFQGTVDFILSQTEAVIQGFNTAGGHFNGLREDQIAVGLPACSNAAGGGYISPDSVKAAINYLKGLGPKPGHYTKVSSYPGLRGMMDWSINWDKVATCGGVYEYANSFNSIFHASQTLNLTLFIQGFYNSTLHNTRRDTVRVYLRDTLSPHIIIDSSKAYIGANGSAVFNFKNAQNGKRYYIHIKHRNSLETWSKAGGEIFTSNVLNYNLTTSTVQVFGNNMILVDTAPAKYGIYSGDVNQSGTVDLNDMILITNGASSFLTGYQVTDVNGDNLVNLNDIIIAYNNSVSFVVRIIP